MTCLVQDGTLRWQHLPVGREVRSPGPQLSELVEQLLSHARHVIKNTLQYQGNLGTSC